MIRRVYTRCNSGHYFVGECCPLDGWSSPASKEISAAVKRLAKLGRKATVEELRNLAVSDAAIAKTIIIEFGSESAAFEAISPEHLVVNGETIAAMDLDESFT